MALAHHFSAFRPRIFRPLVRLAQSIFFFSPKLVAINHLRRVSIFLTFAFGIRIYPHSWRQKKRFRRKLCIYKKTWRLLNKLCARFIREKGKRGRPFNVTEKRSTVCAPRFGCRHHVQIMTNISIYKVDCGSSCEDVLLVRKQGFFLKISLTCHRHVFSVGADAAN